MIQTAKTIYSLYDQLMNLPETLTGEILNGQLHAQPRPTGPHALTGSSLGDELVGPFQKGRGGPGGWWIIDEPEIHFVRDTEVAVPDLAGWKRERMPAVPRDHRFEVIPNWVCEILSPSTASKDREIKMPLYARHGVQYAWIVDPFSRALEAMELKNGTWTLLDSFSEEDLVAVVPFDAITIALSNLWG
jgi:Uma2 family endonuclease